MRQTSEQSEPVNFEDLIHKTDTCHLWTGRRNKDGYAIYKGKLAHRIVFIAAHGGYPKGTVTDHLCRVRHCVRIEHLEAVTIGENVRRGMLAKLMVVRHQSKTHCPHDHPYVPENLYLDLNADGYIHRKCKICAKERRHEQYLREKTLRETSHVKHSGRLA
jgi:hypothetical protein